MRLIMRFLLFTLVSATIVWAVPTGNVSGFVYDDATGEALIGANVYIENLYVGSSTNTSGFYAIPKLKVGQYNLICQYMGYETVSQTITVKPNSNIEVDFRLETTTIQTEEVAVVADSVRTSTKLYQKPISQVTLTPRQIDKIPQVVEADLLRSLQTMPGIAAVSDFSSELYVRGGTPDQNLYLMDGTDVYNPEHLFGLFSTFNTDAIKNVEISKGGFGAEYGGRLSSVLDVTNLDGNRREYAGKASVSILSAKTTLQSPLGDFGAISGSIRRTYFDKTIARMEAFKDENIPDYYFWDGHLKAYFDLGHNDKLTLSSYRGYDKLDFVFDKDNPNSEQILYDWGNTTYSARWTHIFSPQLFSNFWITSSEYDANFDLGEDFDEENDLNDYTVKGNFEYYYSSRVNIKLGFEHKWLRMRYLSDFPGGEVAVDQKPRHLALYVQHTWDPSPLLQIQSGLRYNTMNNGGTRLWDFDPRLSAKYRLTDTINLRAAGGRYHQYLFKIPREFITDIWSSSDQYYADAKSNHFILGIQKEVANDWSLEVETYFKDYQNVYYFDPFFWVDLRTDTYNETGEPLYDSSQGLYNQGEGESYGLEFLLRKETGPLTGWVSATLGRVENWVDGINRGERFVPRHDRTVTFNVIGNMDVKNTLRMFRGQTMHEDKGSWKFGMGFTYATGQPITTTSSIYFTSVMPDQQYYSGYNLYPTERNNFRLPPYIRLDLSLTYTHKYTHVTFEPFLQIFNATNRRNVWFIQYKDEIQDQSLVQNIDAQGMLPILPSIGFNLIF